MTKKLLLNVVLLAACVYVGRTVMLDYREFDATHKVMTVEPESAEKKDKAAARAATPRASLNANEFMVISEKNLFLESRNLQAASAAPVVEVAPPLNPKPTLMGVATVGDAPRAFIQNVRAQAGQKATKTLKLGDTYEGYKVSKIQRNRVELTYTSSSGNVTTQVLDLNDPAQRGPRPQGKTPVTQSQVISVGGQPVNAGGQQAAAAALPPGQALDEQGRRVVRTPFGDVLQGGGAAGGTPARAGLSPAQQLQQQQLQEQTTLQQQQKQNAAPPRNQIIDDQGRRVIRTPFGDIVRPPDTPPPPPQS